MKEIKFRALDRRDNRVKKINAIHYDDFENIIGVNFGDKPTKFVKIKFVGELMQFTGLKDKNGKEIFEGDIVTKSLKDCGRIIGNFLVKWNLQNVSFDITGTGGHQYEVIGNIYKNPELLEEKK